ncbi:MAG TPA: BON domain-containing protein [Steroidobacteraceae bacterium]
MKSQTAAVLALAFSLGAAAAAQAQSPAPDNTKTNANSTNSTDKSSTADGQANNSTDITLTKAIRQRVMGDKSLSTYAHNVKIVSVNGAVTLNGVVRDNHEKTVVASEAEEVAGKGKVTNLLKVAPSH